MATPISSHSQEKTDVAEKLTEQFLSNAEDYFRTEIKLISSDYDCLNQMNTVALDKYNQIHRKLERMNDTIRTLNDTNSTKFLSTFGQLNDIEDAMSNLESTIMKLDAYSRSLESQVKKYEKTILTNRTVSPTRDS